MKKYLRVLSLVMALIFAVSFVACSNTEENSAKETTKENTTKAKTTKAATTTKSSTTEKKETTKEANPLQKKYEITWGLYDSSGYIEGRWDELELEEKFNVDLKVWNIDFNNKEQCTMMKAAGDFPDFAFGDGLGGAGNYEDGLIRTIPEDMIRQYAPKYVKYLDEAPDGWIAGMAYDEETGERYDDLKYCLNLILPFPDYQNQLTTFRLDWLENLGYNVEDLKQIDTNGQIFVSNRQFTFDEFNDIMRGFTEDDPDGNGENDTIGTYILFRGYERQFLEGMFGVSEYPFDLMKDEVTGDYVEYFANNAWKDLLAYDIEMREKGYFIEPTGDDPSWWWNWVNSVNTGRSGMMLSPQFSLGSDRIEAFKQYPPNQILRENPDARVVITKNPLGPDGESFLISNAYSKIYGAGFQVGVEVDDNELARILQIFEYTHLGDKSFRYLNGIEGIHYKWAGEPFKSALLKTPKEDIPVKYKGEGTAPVNIFNSGRIVLSFAQYFNYYPAIVGMHEYYVNEGWNEELYERQKVINPTYVNTEFYEEYEEVRDEVKEDYMKVFNDFKERAYNGEIADINSEWSSYIDTLYSSGYEKIVDFYNSDKWGFVNPQ